MTKSAIAFTSFNDSETAGKELGTQIKNKLTDYPVKVLIVFASSSFDYDVLLASIKEITRPEILVGSSSAGEFISENFETDSACAIAIYSDEIKFSAGLARGIQFDREPVAEKLFSYLQQKDSYQYQYHSAMIFADALSGYTDELIDLLTEKTVGEYQFFGGGAGDNANFMRTHVFFGDSSYTDSAVVLEMLSNKPIGVGVSHGWRPVSDKMRVTEANGRKLISLNGKPALEIYKEFAKKTGQLLDEEQPVPFFLNNILGIEIAGGYKLRAPIAIIDDGAICLASDIPVGVYASIMGSDSESTKTAAVDATINALAQLGGLKPNVALFFDCVATRLRMGKEFDYQLEKVGETLKGVGFAGCNTYGQVARVNGQFSGFQNCSAVVCIIPE